MEKSFKLFLPILKLTLFLIAFGLSGYIILQIYNYVDNNFFDVILCFLPFVLLIGLFICNMIKRQDSVNNNVFYNVACILVSLVIIIVCLRTVFDKNLLLNEDFNCGINFIYFSDFIMFMKLMIYGLIVSNGLFILKKK